MSGAARICNILFWLVVLAGFAVAGAMAVWYAPIESTMGVVQKIFYLHLPVAITTFLAALIVFISGIGYLWQRRPFWDDLGAAAGKVTALYCAAVLLTGMTWAHSAWGHWWTWSPRLTFSLVLLLLYVVYVMLRPSIESTQRRAIVCAVYGIAAFLDVPIVYLSVRLLPDIHPSSIALDGRMKTTLLVWFVPVMLLAFGLITARYRLNRLERTAHESGAHVPVAVAATS
jgi:heme exporter protein C